MKFRSIKLNAKLALKLPPAVAKGSALPWLNLIFYPPCVTRFSLDRMCILPEETTKFMKIMVTRRAR